MNNSQINNIEWKDGAVCFANGAQWFTHDGCYFIRKCLISTPEVNSDTTGAHLDWLLQQVDFQLNEIRQCDYIEASELDTEQKYNDAVEVFKLYGCGWSLISNTEFSEFDSDSILIWTLDCLKHALEKHIENKRKITYDQIMAIGKLKRLMNERNNTVLSLDEETELKSRSMASELNSQSNDDEWPKVGDEATHSVCGLCKVMSLADSNGVVAVLNESGFNVLVFNSHLSKPKTPEDLISEELAKKGVQDVYILACQIINGEFDSIKHVPKGGK